MLQDHTVTENKLEHSTTFVATKEEKGSEWYFDSGCSRNMTKNKEYLADFKEMSKGKVTFGDGVKGGIKGNGVTRGACWGQFSLL